MLEKYQRIYPQPFPKLFKTSIFFECIKTYRNSNIFKNKKKG